MPRLIRKIEGYSESIIEAGLYSKSFTGNLQLDDYIRTVNFIGFLQNFLNVKITELFVENKDAYRSPDDGNHPGLFNNGYYAKTEYKELIISY